MKKFILLALLVCQNSFASEVLLRDKEISLDTDQVTLLRDGDSPKEFFLTLKTKFVNRNVNMGCEEMGEVERTGPHASCPPVNSTREVCEKKQSSEVVARSNCTVTQGQDCKMEITKRWTECQLVTQTSLGSCTYRERACVRYAHPTQERLISVLVKFHRSAEISGKEKERLFISLQIANDGKTPSWELKFLDGQDYEIEKKEGNRIFSKDPYYLISK